MKPELQTIIKQYNALPEAIQQTIFYGDVTKVVGEIGSAYGLTPEQIVALENEVTLVLLLLQPHGELVERLTNEFKISAEVASSMVFLLDSILIVPTFSRITIPTDTTTENAPATSTLPTVRTMATDQETTQGLGQDELLKK